MRTRTLISRDESRSMNDDRTHERLLLPKGSECCDAQIAATPCSDMGPPDQRPNLPDDGGWGDSQRFLVAIVGNPRQSGRCTDLCLELGVVGASSTAKARVAFFKRLLILGAAIAVAVHVGWHIIHPTTPIVASMGVAALLSLAANLLCLRLLHPYRNGDVNMTSVWECSRNDVLEGPAAIVAAVSAWLFDSGWPDILVAIALLILFLRSATRVLTSAWRQLHPAHSLSLKWGWIVLSRRHSGAQMDRVFAAV